MIKLLKKPKHICKQNNQAKKMQIIGKLIKLAQNEQRALLK